MSLALAISLMSTNSFTVHEMRPTIFFKFGITFELTFSIASKPCFSRNEIIVLRSMANAIFSGIEPNFSRK